MDCLKNLPEIIIAITPLLLGLLGSHIKLKKQINCNNGYTATQMKEMKEMIEEIKEITRRN